MGRIFSLLALCIAFAAVPVSAEIGYDGKVRRIDIINWTHTDYGFTDHPLILFELQKRYIDIAIDYTERSAGNALGERFTWTVEALDPLWRWWNEADEARRKKLLKAVDRGQIDINIMPFNIHPCYNEAEMEQLLSWIPDELRKRLKIGIAIQNDVNGFPRAVAERLPGMGVDYVWLGMNGHHPFPVPTLSKWELEDGKHVWLWNGGSYWDAYDYFSPSKWRTWQCEANDLMYRWPREGEIFASDEKSVLEAHDICVKKLAALEKKGYSYPVLPITFSSQWRCDNDGPFYGIVDFVKTWNRMGLRPELKLSTATASLRDLVADNEPSGTVQGEFGDWWAFGLASLPREHSAARSARHILQASMSDVLGKPSERDRQEAEGIMRDICTFYEHTFASMFSSSKPYGAFNQGSEIECSRYAYKAYEFAKWMSFGKDGFAKRMELYAKPENGGFMNTLPLTTDSETINEYFDLFGEGSGMDGLSDAFTYIETGGMVEGTKVVPGYLSARQTKKTGLTVPGPEGNIDNCNMFDLLNQCVTGSANITEYTSGEINIDDLADATYTDWWEKNGANYTD